MRSFVITMVDNPHSMKYADRCIASGAKFETQIDKFNAIVPAPNLLELAAELNIPTDPFREKYSRFENCLAAFLSHRALWKKCVELDEEVQIFEHDAVLVHPLPEFLVYKGCISLGAPSYGKFRTPSTLGVNVLTSKPYFPGAHAYRLRPDRALTLCHTATIDPRPTDVYLDIRRFDFLEEYYPWPVEARDDFTTIQNPNGIVAKHRNGPGYQIL